MNNLLKKSIEKYQKTQNLIYEIEKLSNEIRTISKTAIALLRRDNIVESKNNIKKAEKLFRLINEITKKSKDSISRFSYIGRIACYKEAVEEYIEAIIFYNFLTKSKKEIPNFIEFKPEDIIFGICDFTGELVRRAVNIANSDNLKKLVLYREAIESIVEELTKIGFKGKIRQKYDETERNLKKIENILYDIKLKT